MNQKFETLNRLYDSDQSAEEAFKKYNKDNKTSEQFFVYPLISERRGDAVSLLNECRKKVYLLPCAITDSFQNVPGEYPLDQEVILCNRQLANTSVLVTLVKFIIKQDGKSFLQIGTQRFYRSILVVGMGSPMVPRWEDFSPELQRGIFKR